MFDAMFFQCGGKKGFLGISLAFALVVPSLGASQFAQSPESTKTTTIKADIAALLETQSSASFHSRLLVKFDGPLTDVQKQELANSGLTILSPAGDGAFYVRVDSSQAGQDKYVLDKIRSAKAISLVDKVAQSYRLGHSPEHAIVGWADEQDPIVAAYIIFHDDVDFLVDGVSLVSDHQSAVVDLIESMNGLVIELPMSEISALAEEDGVKWIEPPLPLMSGTNANVRYRTQADNVQAVPYNLDGTGVSVMIYDAGTVFEEHVDFGSRVTIGDSRGDEAHATHVAGTVGGDGTAMRGLHRGMAPNCSMVSYGVPTHYGSGILLYTNPGDLESDYQDAVNNYDISVTNNSIGTNIEINLSYGFDCEWQGDYGVTAALIDEVVRGSLGKPLTVVWAAGNERQGTLCNVEGYGDYYSLAPPSSTKNAIVVGAVHSDTDAMTYFSSWGPTDDGRLKPDICAPGCQNSSDYGVTSTVNTGTTDYDSYCGTSMASPAVTGLVALILEDYRIQFPGQSDPLNATIKALLAQTAVDRGNAGPDYQYGYGSVRVRDAIDLMRTGQFVETEIAQGDVVRFIATVPSGASELRATLAWDDYPGNPAASQTTPKLVNDLDIRVFAPDGTRYYPWTLNPLSPSSAAVRITEDHLNNIEQVFVASPEEGAWLIEVVGYNVPMGLQSCGLCVSQPFEERYFAASLPSGVPSELVSGVTTDIPVEIELINDTLVPSGTNLFVRYAGDDFIVIPIEPIGGNEYVATLPAPTCEAAPEFYITIEATHGGVKSFPEDAPNSVSSAIVNDSLVVFADDFETDLGWTVENDQYLTAGAWERGIPADDGDSGDPTSDYDGSGQCYLTGNFLGNSDVDGGVTALISPEIAITNVEAEISYALSYYSSIADGDYFKVFVSTDSGTTWVLADAFYPVSAGGWTPQSIVLSEYAEVTQTLQLRFEVADIDLLSLVEAAIDSVTVTEYGCSTAFNDCDGNGIVDFDDIAAGRLNDADQDGIPDTCVIVGDLNCDGVIDVFDIDPFVQVLVDTPTYTMLFPACQPERGDINGDGVVDVFDIDPFVALLVGG